MKTHTFFDSPDFRKEVLKGIRDLAMITSQTLGPGGRAILLEQENGSVLATKDGVTVAKHFAANSAVQNLVSKAAIEASERTVHSCGDGTTTSMLLAFAIVEAGQLWLEKNPSYSPQRLARELKDTFQNSIRPMILGLSRPIRDLSFEEAKQAVWHVAMVSSNSDTEIADAVAEAVGLVGEDGMVQVEEGTGLETTVRHQEGFPVNSGLGDLGGSASAAFMNRKAYGDCVLSGAYVVLFDGEINEIETAIPLLERISKEVDEKGMAIRHPLVIVAHGFGDNVLRAFAQNFRQQSLSVVPFVTPRNGQAHGRQGFLHDLSAYTGGQVFEPQGNPLLNAMPSNIGFSEEVRIGVSQSVFMTSPDENAVTSRIAELKGQMEGSSEFDCDRLRYRIGQLTGGVATVFAGGSTAFEAKERRDRVVDAVSAVRSAIDQGVVPGGGAALLHVSRQLPTTGFNQILSKALTRPFTQILLNSGVASNEEEALFIGNQVGLEESSRTLPDGQTEIVENPRFFVYDALKREVTEFWASGIFDPAKVTITALQNALSVAQLLMTCGGAISRQPSEGESQIREMQKGLMQAMSSGELP